MPRRYAVSAALLAFFAAGLYSGPALCCDAEGIGSSKQPTLAAAVVRSAPSQAPDAGTAPAPAPAPGSEVAAAPPAVTPGATATNDDAGSNLGDGVGASSGAHKRGLRWQSFLPGVIK